MNKTNGIIAITHILEMMRESEHIDGDFKEFIRQCIGDYLHNKKLGYSLISVVSFRLHWLDKETIKELKEKLDAIK